MVAASKMRKAQQHALAGRPYAALMNKVLVSLQQRTDPRLHPLLQVREVKKEMVIVISTDKGLAGALNTNLLREAARFEAEQDRLRRGWPKGAAIPGADKARVARRFRVEGRADLCRNQSRSPSSATEKFLSSRSRQGFGGLHALSSTRSINGRSVQTLLPIEHGSNLPEERGRQRNQATDPMLGYIFEPNAEGVLEVMLPYYLQYQVFQMILDARASEHSARMVAMKNATDNAQAVHQGSDAGVQQNATGQHHDRVARNRNRANGARSVTNEIYEYRKYCSSHRPGGRRGVCATRRSCRKFITRSKSSTKSTATRPS